MLRNARRHARLYLSAFLILCTWLALMAVAWAGPPGAPDLPGQKPDTAAAQLVDILFKVLSVVLTTLVTVGMAKFVRFAERKGKIDLSERQEAFMADVADDAIDWIEEQAHKRAKAKAQQLTGPEKLELAARELLSRAHEKGWDDWTAERVRQLLEARLQRRRRLTAATELPAAA